MPLSPTSLVVAQSAAFPQPGKVNLLLAGIVGLVALDLTVDSSTSFINFGAFRVFAFVNILVIAQYMRDRHTHPRNVFSWVVAALIGLAVII